LRCCKICFEDYEHYGQTSSYCRPCRREYDRAYHKRRSESSLKSRAAKQDLRRVVATQFVWDYLKLNPCQTCGESDPVVLEFDHIDRDIKSGEISSMINGSLAKLKAEINKCRVLCANCHRRHTAIQFDWYSKITR